MHYCWNELWMRQKRPSSYSVEIRRRSCLRLAARSLAATSLLGLESVSAMGRDCATRLLLLFLVIPQHTFLREHPDAQD